MTYVADLHVHSPYSIATSKALDFDGLACWARIKGIDLLASADFTHPAWYEETRRKLREADGGLYEYRGVKFVLGTEVNCIVEQGGRRRRIHLLLYAPDLDTVARINRALASKGRLGSDGRPTLRISPRELLLTLLELDDRSLVIPAHVWTPWFGIYGSKSGFDSLEECFGDVADRIYAVETGLSSEPAMNWRIPELDSRSLVSFSDAHSLPKLGRELTVLSGELSYDGLVESLKSQGIAYTVEFFPQEGKYHYSGHRKCEVCLSPVQVLQSGRACPVCGRGLTMGVMQRVDELASREVATWMDAEGFTRAENGRPPFKMLVALRQIIAESLGKGISTKSVQTQYHDLIDRFGSEMSVLIEASPSELAQASGERTAEGVVRVRRGEIAIEPGYDGLYGKVKVWPGPAGSNRAT